ncbi:hypothetical protein B0X65_08130 [Helicobacter pylori]|nr:hypothetical protein B0X65_08130 [Helicobacter pylori]
MGLRSLNYSFWCFFMGIDTKIRLNYKAISHQHPMRAKPFKRALKRGLSSIEPKPLKIFSLDRLLWLFLKP